MHGIFPIKPPIVSAAGLPTPVSLGSASKFHSSGGTDTLTIAATSNIQAGDLVVVAFFGANATSVSLSDGTNTYTKAATISDGATPPNVTELWYVENAAAVASPSITMNTTAPQTYLIQLNAARIASGIVSALDKTAANSGIGVTSVSATTAVISQANEIAFGALGYNTFGTVTESTGFTRILLDHGNGNTLDLSYRNLSSAIAVAFAPSFTPSANAGGVVATFKRP